MMTFLADENFPRPDVVLIRAAGHIVHTVLELSPGIPDHEVVLLAKKLDAVILTSDSDYGGLIIQRKMAHPPGVIYFRVPDYFNGELSQLLFLNLVAGYQFDTAFTVITRQKVRQIQYPV